MKRAHGIRADGQAATLRLHSYGIYETRRPSPFFWWIRALLAIVGAVAVFPIAFAVIVKLFGLTIA